MTYINIESVDEDEVFLEIVDHSAGFSINLGIERYEINKFIQEYEDRISGLLST